MNKLLEYLKQDTITEDQRKEIEDALIASATALKSCYQYEDNISDNYLYHTTRLAYSHDLVNKALRLLYE